MKLIYKQSFRDRLSSHIEFIARNNYPAAKKLKSQLLDQIKRIPDNPYMFRQSIYFNNKEIRDLVYKGCTVVYKIESKRIIVFGFLKYQEFPTDKKKW